MGKKRRKLKATQKGTSLEGSNISRHEAIERADSMIQAGDPESAIQLLKPLAERYKRDGRVQYYLGYSYVKAGRVWEGIPYYKKALEITRDPELWFPLGYLYLELDMRASARKAFQQVLRHGTTIPSPKDLERDFALLDEDIREMAEVMELSKRVVEEGLLYMEEGQIALQNSEYLSCINLNRKAIKHLGSFPPPHNNLSLAQFFHGQPREAIRTAQQVLENHPGNIHAVANIIRYLVWTGQVDRANPYWQELQRQSPVDDTLRFKILEAAAIIEDDHIVYELGKGFGSDNRELMRKAQFYLAVAEANLGMRSARRRLKKLKDDYPWAEDILVALKKSQTGLGWSQRFPYLHSSELIPKREFERLVELFQQHEQVSFNRLRSEIKRLAERFPQVVLMGKKIILEEQKPELGIQLLEAMGTAEAYDILREFGLGQQGSNDARLNALYALLDAEQFQPGATVRFWQNGDWHDVQLQHFEIVDDDERPYSPQVVKLLNRALVAFQNDQNTEAEKLFEQALALEPNAKEAYNNLGTIYAHKGEHQRAAEMFERAVEIDPLYVMARCNLASFAIDDKSVEKAEELLAPLGNLPRYSTQAFVFLSFIRARIALLNNEYDQALNHLEIAIKMDPEYEPAVELRDRIGLIQNLRSGIDSWREQSLKRQSSARARLQKKISTLDPTLAEALSIHTKEMMTGMARAILPWGGWTALKKAGLYNYLINSFQDQYIIDRLIKNLSDEERRALKMVSEQKGYINWQKFVDLFGDDLEESPYWQYHQPETVMGRLRVRCLLVEGIVAGELILAIPVELREPLRKLG